MIRSLDGRVLVEGAMNHDAAKSLLEDGRAGMLKGETLFDLSGVSEVDSSGLAVIFGWQRAAQEQGKTVRVANAPANLLSLAELYGVSALLPLG